MSTVLVTNQEIHNWTETTYDLLPSHQPGPEVAVDATRKIFEYFQPILSPGATREDKLELLKRISQLCHATRHLGNKIYKSRVYELRRVSPAPASASAPGDRGVSAVSTQAPWVEARFVEDERMVRDFMFDDKITPTGWGQSLPGEELARYRSTTIAYGLSAAVLRHDRVPTSEYFGSSAVVLERARVVVKRRNRWVVRLERTFEQVHWSVYIFLLVILVLYIVAVDDYS